VFLRSLTVRGFKSFADRTALEFSPGISVIVGPNGSGKSNIADAIAWVLGEQGPRALRGAQMSDVIFAGSPSRQALGMAEVNVVIDNAAGLIPIPASEIEISRAVFRSGDSEYRLGGRPCRLLDIQELLSDSGIGRAMHTIVSQGHLEDVLAARPEERRQFIEEAAGIAKHRRRRERAERKLAGLEQDLLRLQDLVGEVRRQLRPLKQQAELAERHEQLSREADELAVSLAAARLRDLIGDRNRRAPTWQEAEARQAEARARLQNLDAEIAGLDDELAAKERAAREAEDAHAVALEARSAAEVRLRIATRVESTARERVAQAANRSGRLFALEEELARTERALEEVVRTLAGREAEAEAAELEFRAAQQARRDAEDERRRLSEEAASRRAEAEALGRALTGHDAELETLRAARAAIAVRIHGAQAEVATLTSEIERLDALETPIAVHAAAIEKERAAVQAHLVQAEAEEKGVLARQSVVEARRAELAESPGALHARRKADRTLGLLREMLGAPPHLGAAVRGALGGFADAVVYEREEQALADAGSDGGHGLVLVVAGREMAPPWPGSPPGSSSAVPGNERSLLDQLHPDRRISALARTLLGNVFLARNPAEAAARRRVHPGAVFVTPEGLVLGQGFVRAAAGHDARLQQVLRDVGSLERELGEVRRSIREASQRANTLAEDAERSRAGLEALDQEISSAAERHAAARTDLAGVLREDAVLGERMAAVQALAAAAREQLPAWMAEGAIPAELPALPAVPEAPVHLRVEVETLRRDRARLEAGVARTRREVQELSAEDPVALRQAIKRAEVERAGAEAGLREAEEGLAAAMDGYRAATVGARDVRSRHDQANRAWREAAALAERLRAEHEEEDRARVDLERRIGEAERLLRGGHGTEPETALAALGEDDTVQELLRRSDTVARRMGLLGKVNLLAVGELGALQERHDFIVRELADVRAARQDLQEVIEDVDRRMAELFRAAFDDVAREYEALFASMFPGGEGRLVLTDPADPLGAGIEVEARPGRKKVKRLSLLSGGERSLAALAFLFAIFRARPSPFYLMDEVEAALDDINLHRFLEVVREFAAASQVIIVTHQKRTMETADALYGVSMGPGGASTVISQRLVDVPAR
jgi:chromosome segregation protein